MLRAVPSFLPGDPPFAELGVLVALIVIVISAALALFAFARRFERVPGLAILGLKAACLLMLVSVWPIAARNFGRWALLRQQLQDYSAVAASYEQSHGRIQSDAEANRFYELHPAIDFDLGPTDGDVRIVYLWRHRPGRVGIVWGGRWDRCLRSRHHVLRLLRLVHSLLWARLSGAELAAQQGVAADGLVGRSAPPGARS